MLLPTRGDLANPWIQPKPSPSPSLLWPGLIMLAIIVLNFPRPRDPWG